ncbi:unnamed protein product [Lathyrus sativus]|nr:unnamed protein product [Lathyrus sativus]
MHKQHVLWCYFIFLVGTQLFVDTSSTYTDIAYLRYFLDSTWTHEYNRGEDTLAYTYSRLGEGCLWKTRIVTGSVSLIVAWIFHRFPMNAEWGSVFGYTELMLCARAFLPLRRNQAVDPYRVYLDRLAAEEIHHDVYADHHVTRPFDDISLFSGWLVCN